MPDGRPVRLLFVCSGNICRSPTAEALAVALAARRGLDVEVRSAGTLGLVGHGAAEHAIAVADEHGLDLEPHRSQALSDALVAWADWVVGMDLGHAVAIRQRFPDVGERLVLLGPFAGVAEIADPMGSRRPMFRHTFDVLERGISALLEQVAE